MYTRNLWHPNSSVVSSVDKDCGQILLYWLSGFLQNPTEQSAEDRTQRSHQRIKRFTVLVSYFVCFFYFAFVLVLFSKSLFQSLCTHLLHSVEFEDDNLRVIKYLDFLMLQFQLEQSITIKVHKAFDLSSLMGWPKSKLFQNPNTGTRLPYKCRGGGVKHLPSFLHVLRCLSNWKKLCENESCPSLLYSEEEKGFLGRSVAWDMHSIGFTGRCRNHRDSYEHLSHYC